MDRPMDANNHMYLSPSHFNEPSMTHIDVEWLNNYK